MEFVNANKQIRTIRGTKQTDILELIDGFGRSGQVCSRVVNWDHKDARSCANSIRKFLDVNRIPFVRVSVRRGEVYLINTLLMMKNNQNGES